MRFMIIVKASKDSEAGVMPGEALFAEMGRYHEELEKAGILLAASGLQASSKGWRIKYDGAGRSFTDGPFPETKELIAGWFMIDVESEARAHEVAAWVSSAPGKGGEPIHEWLEVRPVMDDAPANE
jgi:hypothetical protein